MRILILIANYYPALSSGVAKSVWTEAQQLAALGHEITVVTRRLDRTWDAHERLDYCKVYRYDVPEDDSRLFLINPLYTFVNLPGLVRRLHRRRPFDVAYVHNPYQGLALRSLTQLDVPMVYAFHFPLFRDVRIEAQYGKFGSLDPLMKAGALGLRAIERYTLQHADLIIVHSQFMRDLMQRTCGPLRQQVPIEILPLAVDEERFAPAGDRTAAREQLGIPGDRDVLLTVRRLVGRMGLTNLIDAMTIVRQRNPRVLLLIGGTGYLESALQQCVADRGLRDNVRLLGLIPEQQLVGYYQAADLFVLPTHQMEGFGLVTIESLSCGTPVIATPVGANPEVLGPLDPMLLCANATPEALAERINSWLDCGVSPRLRKACREYAVSRFAVEGVVIHLERILAETAASAGVE